jgi:hypothetical protein
MVPTPTLNEDQLDLVITHSVECDERIYGEIITAFHSADIDVSERPTQLFDWINSDVLEDIRWDSVSSVYLSKRIWGKRVIITAEEIRIYDPMDLKQPG